MYTNYRCIPFPPNDYRVSNYHLEFSTQHCLGKASMSFKVPYLHKDAYYMHDTLKVGLPKKRQGATTSDKKRQEVTRSVKRLLNNF